MKTYLQSPLFNLISAYTLLSFALSLDNGSYSPFSLFLTLFSVFAIFRSLQFYRQGNNELSVLQLEKVAAASLAMLLVFSIPDTPGIYLHHSSYRWGVTLVEVLLLFALYLFAYNKISASVSRYLFWWAIACGIVFRLLMPWASPYPIIDVFVQFQESAQNWLLGLNPYMTQVSDVYQGKVNFGYEVLGYSYPPLNLYLHTLFYFFTQDIRFAYIFFEIVFLIILLSFLKFKSPHNLKLIQPLTLLLFVYHSRGLFVIEQAWTEPFLVGFFALFIFLKFKNKTTLASSVFGLFLSLKQYLVFVGIQALMIERRFKIILLSLLFFLLTLLPFVFIDFKSMWQYGFLFQFNTAFRSSGLTIIAGLYDLFGIKTGKTLSMFTGLIITVLCFWKLKRDCLIHYLYAILLSSFGIFLTGSQAFCNYYYFLGSIILLLIALLIREAHSA